MSAVPRLPSDSRNCLAALSPVRQRLVRVLRLWLAGPAGQQTAWCILCHEFDPPRATDALRALERLVAVIAEGAARPIRHRPPPCPGLHADEAVLSAAVEAAGTGDFATAAALLAPLVVPEARAAAVGSAGRLGAALGAVWRAEPTHPGGALVH